MGHVVSIVYRPQKTGRPLERYERVAVDRALLAEFQGIVGDVKGSATRRQLNVMFAETLAGLAAEGFRAGPGELGEQIVLAGVDPEAVVEGARLKLGDAVIEIGIPRTGCARFEMIHGRPRADVKGRLGVMATVVTGGEVAVGDPVEVLPAE